MTENHYKYPDETIFHGIPDNPNGFTFFEARQLTNENEKISKLKIRLASYYISGLKEMTNPFTISVLTCVGIEILGQVFLGFNNKGESLENNTILIYEMLDSKMSESLSIDFKRNYNLRRNSPGHNIDYALDLTNYARVVRKGLRNAFTHTYRSLGVMLGGDQTELLSVNESFGCLVINPFLFRERFIALYEKLFTESISESNLTHRQNALNYFNLLIIK